MLSMSRKSSTAKKVGYLYPDNEKFDSFELISAMIFDAERFVGDKDNFTEMYKTRRVEEEYWNQIEERMKARMNEALVFD